MHARPQVPRQRLEVGERVHGQQLLRGFLVAIGEDERRASVKRLGEPLDDLKERDHLIGGAGGGLPLAHHALAELDQILANVADCATSCARLALTFQEVFQEEVAQLCRRRAAHKGHQLGVAARAKAAVELAAQHDGHRPHEPAVRRRAQRKWESLRGNGWRFHHGACLPNFGVHVLIQLGCRRRREAPVSEEVHTGLGLGLLGEQLVRERRRLASDLQQTAGLGQMGCKRM